VLVSCDVFCVWFMYFYYISLFAQVQKNKKNTADRQTNRQTFIAFYLCFLVISPIFLVKCTYCMPRFDK